jgi:glutamate-1-semialdehyde 2,1-aminomutase
VFESEPQAQTIDPLPGGAGRSGLVVGGKVPPRAVRGEGCRVQLEDERWVIDAHNNFTVLVHGHADPAVFDAVRAKLDEGISCVGLPNATEAELAATLADRIESIAQVRFTNTGTEAVQTAVRLARAATGRAHVIGVEGAYHGSSDPALSIYGRDYINGVPDQVRSLVQRVEFGDSAGLARAVEACGEDLAIVIVDLMANYTGLRQMPSKFVEAARALCDECGALLAFDEVVSFRHHSGGMQALYGTEPDLTILGKVIGGGLPIGAVGGSAEAMVLLDATRKGSLHSSGTFTGNPLSMAAGLACLATFDQTAIDRLNRLGDRLRSRFREANPPGWEIRGYGSLSRVVGPDGGSVPAEFFWRMLDRGVQITSAALVVLSTPMDEAVADEICDALVATATEMS